MINNYEETFPFGNYIVVYRNSKKGLIEYKSFTLAVVIHLKHKTFPIWFGDILDAFFLNLQSKCSLVPYIQSLYDFRGKNMICFLKLPTTIAD